MTPAASGLRASWAARPRRWPRALWALLIALDVLPWPWGEDIFAGLLMVAGIVRPSRRRRALVWAVAQPGHRPWRLAAALCAFRGRRLARARLLGRRHPDDLRRHLVVEGGQHLKDQPGAAILLGFHLGPSGADVALRILGHRMTWLGGLRVSPGWSRAPWRALADGSETLAPVGKDRFWSGQVLRARRILVDGGKVFLTADCGSGREAFRVPLSGRPALIRSGWLFLHRQTGAPVLPVLTHLEGRTQVVTIHPPLPKAAMARDGDLGACQEILRALLDEYVRRFPAQCTGLAFAPIDETSHRMQPEQQTVTK